jgi:uncharacterized membrane protein
MLQRLIKYVEALEWPSLRSLALVWIATALLTWALVCLLTLLFMYRILEAGLVPYWFLFALALIPISIVTIVVETILYVIGRNRWPNSYNINKRLVLLGTPLGTWLILVIIAWLAGGPDAFVPRL